jgi:hypothetical protein
LLSLQLHALSAGQVLREKKREIFKNFIALLSLPLNVNPIL